MQKYVNIVRGKNTGFSLVEIIVGLVVMNCVITAFAPVITKKVSTAGMTINPGGALGNLKDDCVGTFGEDCVLCNKQKACIVCTKDCAVDEFKDTPACVCKACNATYGATCLTCNASTCLECNATYHVNSKMCEICPVGHMCNGKTSSICPAGTYATGTGNTILFHVIFCIYAPF